MGDGHDHVDVAGLRDRQRRVLWWVLVANGGCPVVGVSNPRAGMVCVGRDPVRQS